MRERPIRRWAELMMFELTNTSEVTLALSTLVFEYSRGNREHLGLLDTSQEAHLPLAVEVLIVKVTKVHCTEK